MAKAFKRALDVNCLAMPDGSCVPRRTRTKRIVVELVVGDGVLTVTRLSSTTARRVRPVVSNLGKDLVYPIVNRVGLQVALVANAHGVVEV